jgi:hypothetical protein
VVIAAVRVGRRVVPGPKERRVSLRSRLGRLVGELPEAQVVIVAPGRAECRGWPDPVETGLLA